MTNGNKAAAIRAKKTKESSSKGSQMKSNEAAKTIICQTCRTTFLCTASAKNLEEHAMNKHNKTTKECFPTATVA